MAPSEKPTGDYIRLVRRDDKEPSVHRGLNVIQISNHGVGYIDCGVTIVGSWHDSAGRIGGSAKLDEVRRTLEI